MYELGGWWTNIVNLSIMFWGVTFGFYHHDGSDGWMDGSNLPPPPSCMFWIQNIFVLFFLLETNSPHFIFPKHYHSMNRVIHSKEKMKMIHNDNNTLYPKIKQCTLRLSVFQLWKLIIEIFKTWLYNTCTYVHSQQHNIIMIITLQSFRMTSFFLCFWPIFVKFKKKFMIQSNKRTKISGK